MSGRTEFGCFITGCRIAARLVTGGIALLCTVSILSASPVSAGGLQLADLIDEALQNSPEIKAAGASASAAGHRISQVQSLADPMVMVGYQNDGFDRFTYGQSKDAQWMFSAAQMVPYPGKRSLKGEIAAKEDESAQAGVVAEMSDPRSALLVEACRSRISTGVSLLDPSSPATGPIVTRWNLRINVDISR